EAVQAPLEEEVGDQARDGVDETPERREEGERNVLGKKRRIGRSSNGKGSESSDHTENRSQKAEHWGNLGAERNVIDGSHQLARLVVGEVSDRILDLITSKVFGASRVDVRQRVRHHAAKERGVGGGELDRRAD